ncbi:MAG: T9SS C-terminal target domain-containing protein [Cryomorphaceae bacterium]|nr:MAG: T9SS C-terminal target domain-containing protein [Cryomorphaceae bacterium]
MSVCLCFNSLANITSIQQRNISPESFSVQFTSSVAGVGVLKFGTSPIGGSVLAGNEILNDHEIFISGLVPASLYHIRAGVVLAPGDTLYSDVEPMMTASLSSGIIKVYFNSAVDHDEAALEPAISLGQDFPDTIIAYLDRAKYTVDFTAYNIDNQNGVIDAINAAYNRGVQVRFVGNYGIANWNYNSISIGVGNKIQRPEGDDIGAMHNKFIVIDANSPDPNDPVVITGSTNFTNNQLRIDPNNLIIFQDQSLARCFTIEFEEMFSGVFGQAKSVKTPREFAIGGKRVQALFSPKSGVENELLHNIAQADFDIYFGIFTLTRANISQALADRANQGIFVAGIVQDINTSSNTYTILQNGLGNRLVLDAFGTMWHHKYAIFDPNCSEGRPIAYTGSANWSVNGNSRSDENVVVVYDENIANQYFQEFMARYKAHNVNEFVDGECDVVHSVTQHVQAGGLRVYPNPSAGEFFVEPPFAAPGMVRVFNSSGQLVKQLSISSLGSAEPVSLSGFNPGLYLLQWQQVDGTWSQSGKVVLTGR